MYHAEMYVLTYQTYFARPSLHFEIITIIVPNASESSMRHCGSYKNNSVLLRLTFKFLIMVYAFHAK